MKEADEMIGYSGHARRYGITRRSINGYSLRGYGDAATLMSTGDAKTDMTNVVAAISIQYDSLSSDMGKASTILTTFPSTYSSAMDALAQADKSIMYLKGDGAARVLSGDLSKLDWVDLANTTIDGMAAASRVVGKNNLVHFTAAVIADVPKIVGQEVTTIAATGGKALFATGLVPWLVGGAVALGLGYIVIGQLMNPRRRT